MSEHELITLLGIDNFFEDESKRRAEETVAPEFRRFYSANPLHLLMRKEEKAQLRRHATEIKDYLKETLDLISYGFLTSVLGDNWDKKQKLPLEFRHFENGDLEEYLEQNREDIKEKVGILVQYCGNASGTNLMAAVQGFISVPFHLTPTDKLIKIYQEVVEGVRPRYPTDFFHPENQRTPRVLTRYLVDEVMQLAHLESLPRVLSRQDFKERKLGWMLEQYFAGDVKHALRNAYTEKEFPELYRGGDYEEGDILREVFAHLDFGLCEKEEAGH
jgi:hypothetical protein